MPLRQLSVAVLSMLCVASGASAQRYSAPVWKYEPAQRWVGVWARSGSPVAVDGTQIPNVPKTRLPGAPPPPVPPLKGKYLQRYFTIRAALAKGDMRFDAAANCLPPGLPGMMDMDYPMEILWSPGQVTIIAEYMGQTRRIYTDGRKPGPDTDPTFTGFSVGHWEGDTLVVETTHLRANVYVHAQAYLPLSEALTVTEKFIPIGMGPDVIRYETTLRDPLALTKPIVEVKEFHRARGYSIMESICEENNQDKVDLASPAKLPAAPSK